MESYHIAYWRNNCLATFPSWIKSDTRFMALKRSFGWRHVKQPIFLNFDLSITKESCAIFYPSTTVILMSLLGQVLRSQ